MRLQTRDLSGVNHINLASQYDVFLKVQLEITSNGYTSVEYVVEDMDTELVINDLDDAIDHYNQLSQSELSSSNLVGIYKLILTMNTKAILYWKFEITINGIVDIKYVTTDRCNTVFAELEDALEKYNTLSEA